MNQTAGNLELYELVEHLSIFSLHSATLGRIFGSLETERREWLK
jgi:hypothetical protein